MVLSEVQKQDLCKVPQLVKVLQDEAQSPCLLLHRLTCIPHRPTAWGPAGDLWWSATGVQKTSWRLKSKPQVCNHLVQWWRVSLGLRWWSFWSMKELFQRSVEYVSKSENKRESNGHFKLFRFWKCHEQLSDKQWFWLIHVSLMSPLGHQKRNLEWFNP